MVENKRDLRYEVFKLLQIITAVATFFAAISNIINKRPILVILQPILALIFVLTVLYMQSKSKKIRYFSKIIFMIFFNAIYLPYAWYTSPGTISAIGYYAILTIVLSIFFVEKIIEFIIPISGIAVSVFMIRYEGINPDNFKPFISKEVQINDVTINFIIVIMILFFTITYINRYYVHERERYYKLAITDELTGVYNRRFLLDNLEKLIRLFNEKGSLAILFIDINNFKEINDNYGHIEGDYVLIKLGSILKENFELSGRFGGDEFMVLLPDKNIEEAKLVSKKIKNLFSEYSREKGYDNLSLSIGISSGYDKDIEEIIQEADSYMYINKKSNKLKKSKIIES